MGVPVIGCACEVCKSTDVKDTRLRCSVLIQVDGQNLIVDSGPDFRYQVLRSGIDQLSALLFTHEHKDHTAGMDDVRAFNFIQRQAVHVYASEAVEKALRNDFHYAFAETKYPGVPDIHLHTISHEKPFKVGAVDIIPILVYHHKLPVLGFRIGDFAYITDANFIPDEEKLKLKGVKVLVLNALRKKSHISHFTLTEALSVISELCPERAFLTHISHQMGRHEDVSESLPPHVSIAHDQLEIQI
jgi:phosphoribosyl 1,2-cyclic phosphate phosphodiesterase